MKTKAKKHAKSQAKAAAKKLGRKKAPGKVLDLNPTLAKYAKASPQPRPTEPDGTHEGGLKPPDSAIVKVPTSMPEGIVPVARMAQSMAAQVVALSITAANVDDARLKLVQLKTYKQQLEESRKALTKPLKDHVKHIEEMYRPTLVKLEETDTLLRQKLLVFANEAERAVAEAKAKLTAEAEQRAEAGDHEAALQLATQATSLEAAPVKGSAGDGKVGTTTVLSFKVTDYALIPDEFFSLDEKKLMAAIRSGRRDIPGVEVVEERALRVSAQRGDVQDAEFIPTYPVDAERLPS